MLNGEGEREIAIDIILSCMRERNRVYKVVMRARQCVYWR